MLIAREYRKPPLAGHSVLLLAIALLVSVALPHECLAWGHTGHVQISRLAILALPEEVPGFVRSPQAARLIGELGPEADVSKSTGLVTGTSNSGRPTTARTVHDAERDPGHYIDFDENGVVLGGLISIDCMSATREIYDTAQRAETGPVGKTQYTAGYLYYNLIDHFEQVQKDFGIWRAMKKGIETATDPDDKSYFEYQLQLRQDLTLRDIGYWSHFVADASRPMHVSIHFNGWGAYHNPRSFTTRPIHATFEGAFVRNYVDFAQVASRVGLYKDCGCANEERIRQYLRASLDQVIPVYEAAGIGPEADLYRTAQPAELEIVTQQLAAGVAELRDQIIDAWRQSALVTVGFPQLRVSDIEVGTIPVTPATFGAD